MMANEDVSTNTTTLTPSVSDLPPSIHDSNKSLEHSITNSDHQFWGPIEANASLIIRGTIVGLGIIGALKLSRSIRLFTQFKHAAQVPDEFVAKNIRLSGSLVQVEKDGSFFVRHIPILRLPRLFGREKIDEFNRTKNCILVRLSGVNLPEQGERYIYKTYGVYKYQPRLWFTLISKTQDAVFCEVHIKQYYYLPLFTYSLNRLLVRRGLATIPSAADTQHMYLVRTNRAYAELTERLLLAEQVADRRGVGVWRRRTLYEFAKKACLLLADAVKNSTIFIASKMTVATIRNAVNNTRYIASKAIETGHYVAKEGLPNAAVQVKTSVENVRALSQQHQDKLDKVGQGIKMAGQGTYFVGYHTFRIVGYLASVLYKFFILINRGIKTIRR